MEIWLILGLFGWASLMLTRRVLDGAFPKGESFFSYVKGFILSLILGPICFVYLVMIVIGHLDKRSERG